MAKSSNESMFITSSYLHHLRTIALDFGITLEIETDFEEYLDLCERIDKKSPGTSHAVSYQFNPKYCKLDGASAAWIKGTNREGETVHVQAIKVADLMQSSVHNYLSTMQVYFDDPNAMKLKGATCNVYAPEAEIMNGVVCYHGEIWIRQDFRGQKLAAILPRFAVALAHHFWSPDYVIGLVTKGLVRRGLAAQYGYFQGQEYVTFNVPEDGIELNEWLIWVSRQTYSEMIRQLPSEIKYLELNEQKIAS